jgi:hypothetical protein
VILLIGTVAANMSNINIYALGLGN